VTFSAAQFALHRIADEVGPFLTVFERCVYSLDGDAQISNAQGLRSPQFD
jgi:hypothetical protein